VIRSIAFPFIGFSLSAKTAFSPLPHHPTSPLIQLVFSSFSYPFSFGFLAISDLR